MYSLSLIWPTFQSGDASRCDGRSGPSGQYSKLPPTPQ